MKNKDWDSNLSPEQNYILKQEGTEPPGSSPLNNEKREGSYFCAGCGVKLFESKMKFDSGTGWPSFFDALPNVFETKTDNHIGYLEQSIIVKIAKGTTGTYSMMDPNLLAKGFVITAPV